MLLNDIYKSLIIRLVPPFFSVCTDLLLLYTYIVKRELTLQLSGGSSVLVGIILPSSYMKLLYG